MGVSVVCCFVFFGGGPPMCAVYGIFISTLCMMCNDLDVIQVKSSIFNNTSVVFIFASLLPFPGPKPLGFVDSNALCLDMNVLNTAYGFQSKTSINLFFPP